MAQCPRCYSVLITGKNGVPTCKKCGYEDEVVDYYTGRDAVVTSEDTPITPEKKSLKMNNKK